MDTDFAVLNVAGKGTGLSPLQSTEENISRSAKFRGAFTCVCVGCAAPEAKADGKVSFVGGSRGDTLSAVLKSVKPSSVPVDLNSAKLSPKGLLSVVCSSSLKALYLSPDSPNEAGFSEGLSAEIPLSTAYLSVGALLPGSGIKSDGALFPCWELLVFEEAGISWKSVKESSMDPDFEAS